MELPENRQLFLLKTVNKSQKYFTKALVKPLRFVYNIHKMGRGGIVVQKQDLDALKQRERVLICARRDSDLGRRIEELILQCNGIPCFLGEDRRWSTLLRLAFTQKFRSIAGEPAVILGLSKLAKQQHTPLFIRNVILTAECPQWIRSGICAGLDCKIREGSITGRSMENDSDDPLDSLGEELLKWSSILDCRLKKGEYGLEMELVVFPGKKLPKLPSAARQVVRSWDPDSDVPFVWENGEVSAENH